MIASSNTDIASALACSAALAVTASADIALALACSAALAVPASEVKADCNPASIPSALDFSVAKSAAKLESANS